jgi:hypothetical protein
MHSFASFLLCCRLESGSWHGVLVFATKCIAWHGPELIRSWRLDAKIAFWRRVLGLNGHENARLLHNKIDS